MKPNHQNLVSHGCAASRGNRIIDWVGRVREGATSAHLDDLKDDSISPLGSPGADVGLVLEILDWVEDDGLLRPLAQGPVRASDLRWAGSLIEELRRLAPEDERVARLIGFLDPPDSPIAAEVVPPSEAERLSRELSEVAGENPTWLEAWREFEAGLPDDDRPID